MKLKYRYVENGRSSRFGGRLPIQTERQEKKIRSAMLYKKYSITYEDGIKNNTVKVNEKKTFFVTQYNRYLE